ncbi:MAG: hypothetical protein AAF772_01335 [Acidobacteriota bacterium]
MSPPERTYDLDDFRSDPHTHLARLKDGHVETLTENGEAAVVVMSPATYDVLQIALERGHRWDEALERYESGDRGVEASEVIARLEARLASAR